MPNRNRIVLNNDMFGGLVGRAQEDDIAIQNPTAARWIKKLNDSDSRLISHASYTTLLLNRQLKAVRISFEDAHWFIMYGYVCTTDLSPGFSCTIMTPGLFTLSISSMEIHSSATGAQIRDVIEDQYRGIPDYDGHELEEVMSLFPNLYCYKISDDYPFTQVIERLAGSYLARSYSSGPIMLSRHTCDQLAELFEGGSEHIPYDVVLQGLMSFSWKFLYIEMYRCLEQLYAAPRMILLSEEWNITIPLRDMAEKLERLISWRPKEEDSLTKLLHKCSIQAVMSVCSPLRVDSGGNQTQTIESAAKAIYSLRNRLVHFRASSADVNFNESEWNSLIVSIITLIIEAYGALGGRFHLPQDHRVAGTTSLL